MVKCSYQMLRVLLAGKLLLVLVVHYEIGLLLVIQEWLQRLISWELLIAILLYFELIIQKDFVSMLLMVIFLLMV